MSEDNSLDTLDPEVAALIGSAPADMDLSDSLLDEGDTVMPTKRDLEVERKKADEIPNAADHDRTLQRKIGKFWASMVPGASVARCYFRPHKGPGSANSSLIGEYTIRDIQSGGKDIQSFVLNTLAPTWKGGTYRFYVTDLARVEKSMSAS
ncbi:MAG: hypothetical protein HC882_00400 [Acidobacteria bacterium]|nr:hypothetical protein [Acidobacteriota bacterium]